MLCFRWIAYCKERPLIVNVLLVGVLLLYSLAGGIVFCLLETDALLEQEMEIRRKIVECTTQFLDVNDFYAPDIKANELFDVCINETMPQNLHWTTIGATVFSFASITTVGFGPLELTTRVARGFYIVYCLVGMPVGLVLMANIGKYLEEACRYCSEKIDDYKERKTRRRKSNVYILEDGFQLDAANLQPEEEKEEFEMSAMIIVVLFVLYVAFGVTVMVIASGTHVVDGVYGNFLTFTAVDMSGTVSTDLILFPVGIAYVIAGLALATIAIDVLGNYLRQLHYWGKKPENCGNAVVWFGGKRMTVNELLKAAAEQWGVGSDKIRDMELDKMVNREIDIQEGTVQREPRPDIDPNANMLVLEKPEVSEMEAQTDPIPTPTEHKQTQTGELSEQTNSDTQTDTIEQSDKEMQSETIEQDDKCIQSHPTIELQTSTQTSEEKPEMVDEEIQTDPEEYPTIVINNGTPPPSPSRSRRRNSEQADKLMPLGKVGSLVKLRQGIFKKPVVDEEVAPPMHKVSTSAQPGKRGPYILSSKPK